MIKKFCLGIVWVMVLQASLGAEQPNETASFSGTVIEQRKYSVMVSNGREVRQIHLPAQLPIELVLDRPRIQWSPRMLIQEQIFGSNRADGIARHEFLLPEDLRIEIRFAHANERQRVMQDAVKRLGQYRLYSPEEPSPPAVLTVSGSSGLPILGKVVGAGESGQVTIETSEGRFEAELGNRDAVLSGFSIADLRPFETTLRAEIVQEDDKWVAQQIRFRRQVDPLSLEQPGLPRVLVLGDEVSINYLRPLKEKYASEFNWQRPPENCRGSDNFLRLDEWLGPWDQPGRNWDVIVFNFGLADLESNRDEYQANLSKWLEKLQATGAKLVWVTTTPIPAGYSATDRVIDPPQQVVNLNRWAAESLSDLKTQIHICDLNRWIQDQRATAFANWWKGKQLTFNAKQSQALAEPLVLSVRSVLAGEQPHD